MAFTSILTGTETPLDYKGFKTPRDPLNWLRLPPKKQNSQYLEFKGWGSSSVCHTAWAGKKRSFHFLLLFLSNSRKQMFARESSSNSLSLNVPFSSMYIILIKTETKKPTEDLNILTKCNLTARFKLQGTKPSKVSIKWMQFFYFIIIQNKYSSIKVKVLTTCLFVF